MRWQLKAVSINKCLVFSRKCENSYKKYFSSIKALGGEETGRERERSVVKSVWFFCIGPEFGSQHLYRAAYNHL